MPQRRSKIWWALLAAMPWPIAWGLQHWQPDPAGPTPQFKPLALETSAGMVRVPGGQFAMGSEQPHDHDARPLHRVLIESFWLDAAPVTNAQFAAFIAATQTTTSAERRGKSLVFDGSVGTWREVSAANWRHPTGPESSLIGRDDYPAVQVSWYDAVAYAEWAGKRLPTEAEMEYSARGGLAECLYPWGRTLQPGGTFQANYWQGTFPKHDDGADGFRGLGPVGQYPPNRFALYDMAGNCWQWCADWYASDYYGHSPAKNPGGPATGQDRARRGGCWTSTASAGSGLRVWQRDYAPPGQSTNHTGFRCARSATDFRSDSPAISRPEP